MATVPQPTTRPLRHRAWRDAGGERERFLLWILSALLSEKQLSQQVIVLDSLGYSRLQCLNWLVLPAIGPALGKAMLAIVAGHSPLWMWQSSSAPEIRQHWPY